MSHSSTSSQLSEPERWVGRQVDQWLDFLPMLAPGAGLAAACAYVDSMLALRTTLVGHHVTLADVALWGCFAGSFAWRWTNTKCRA